MLSKIHVKTRCSKSLADTGTIEKWIKKLVVAKIKLVSHDSNVDDANLMKELNKLSREQGIDQKPFNQLSVQCW